MATPIFMNRTKIDQLVYDKSYTAVTVGPGKTVSGEWFGRYAVNRNSPFIEVPQEEKEAKKAAAEKDAAEKAAAEKDMKNDKDQKPTGGKSKK